MFRCLGQTIYASFYSTPTLCGSKTDGQQQIIMVSETLRWRKEVIVERVTQDEERDRGSESSGPMRSSCQGINVSLQPSSVTSATKSPSNCSPLPKRLANAQLMSTDVVSHWRLIALSADWLIRRGKRQNREKGREEEVEEEEKWQHSTE